MMMIDACFAFKILIFPGILAEKTWSWSIRAGQGGPLGELVQWADLIAGLYLLGHEVFAVNTLKRFYKFKLMSRNSNKFFMQL